jgi:hypothetical protein
MLGAHADPAQHHTRQERVRWIAGALQRTAHKPAGVLAGPLLAGLPCAPTDAEGRQQSA